MIIFASETKNNTTQTLKISHTMKTINCNNSSSKSVIFFENDGSILAFAQQDGEYWFSVGYFKTLAGAKRSAVRQLAALGYTFNAAEMKALAI